jgi:UDP-N-acetylmuramoyl-tripeptide--D-alanyl-D-alanine ligase
MNDPRPWTAADLRRATGGDLLSGPAEASFAGLAIDSRRIARDEVFVAIIGATHDGHRFVADVLARGVRGLVVQQGRCDAADLADWQTRGIACVAVADTTRALGDIAAYHRRRCPAKIVALTGSNGKTTTRAMTEAVMQDHFRTLATQGNLNNEIGVPLTLLRLNSRHEVGVVEMGMNHPGEIDRLSAIAAPDVGLITNVAPAHLEGLGSLAGVREAKGELLDHVSPAGRVVLNADDAEVRRLAGRAKAPVVFFGLAPEAAVRAAAVDPRPEGTRFTLHLPQGSCPVTLPVPGAFMVSNALAAAAVGHCLNVPLEAIRAGLETVQPVAGRMQIQHLPGGVTLINDCYNANPASTAAAIRTLAELKGSARGALVMGDMLELGPAASDLHRETGRRAGAAGLKRIWAHGPHAEAFTAGAQEAGMPREALMTGEVAAIAAALADWLRPGDWLLVKGSRGMKMERVIAALAAAAHDQDPD